MLIWRQHRSRTLILGVAFATFLICCVLPLVHLLATTFGEAGATSVLLLDSRQRGLLHNTTILGLGTAAFATAIGSPLGIVLARVPLRRKTLLRLVAGAPVLLPPYVVALAWVHLGSTGGVLAQFSGVELFAAWTHSLPAAIMILSFVLYPIPMLATEMAMRRIDGRLEEAALIVATPRRVLFRISLPLVAPSIIASALIVFVLAVSEFGVPGLLRVRVYTTEVFTAFAALYDFGRAIALAAPLLVLSLVVAVVAAAVLGDRLLTTRRSHGVSPVVFDGWRRSGTVAILLVGAITVALPVLLHIREALGVRSLTVAIAGAGGAIVTSLALAAIGATLVVAVAMWLGYTQARGPRAVRLTGQAVMIALFAVPSTITGVALIGLWNRPGPFGALYGTEAMLLLVYLARFLPVAALILSAATQTVSVSHEEAAATSGIGWFRIMRRIVIPQLRIGLAAAWVVAFVLAFGELGASILVVPPGGETLPIRIYTVIANTPSAQVAALALLQSLVVFAPVAAFGAYISWREAR